MKINVEGNKRGDLEVSSGVEQVLNVNMPVATWTNQYT